MDTIEYVEPPATWLCEVCFRRYPRMMFYPKLVNDKRICDHCFGFIVDKGQGISYNGFMDGD